jgi:hypothetical protein
MRYSNLDLPVTQREKAAWSGCLQALRGRNASITSSSPKIPPVSARRLPAGDRTLTPSMHFSSRKQSSSRLAICSTDSSLTCTAASSSASGIPSNCWHTCATVRAFSLVAANRGWLSRARTRKRRRASPCVGAQMRLAPRQMLAAAGDRVATARVRSRRLRP